MAELHPLQVPCGWPRYDDEDSAGFEQNENILADLLLLLLRLRLTELLRNVYVLSKKMW